MEFAINYRDGYEVCVIMLNSMGRKQHYPLRNFGEHQGDARIFKEADCPELSYSQIRMLIAQFKREVKYKRINNKRFIREEKWKQ